MHTIPWLLTTAVPFQVQRAWWHEILNTMIGAWWMLPQGTLVHWSWRFSGLQIYSVGFFLIFVGPSIHPFNMCHFTFQISYHLQVFNSNVMMFLLTSCAHTFTNWKEYKTIQASWIATIYLKVTIILFCNFGLKHVLRIPNFAICTRKWYRVDKF